MLPARIGPDDYAGSPHFDQRLIGKHPGELAERIRWLSLRRELLAQDADAPSREVTTRDGWRVPGAVPMAQAIHHADDHRTQVLSILGARGLEPPDLGVREYAISAGHMHKLEAASGD